MVVDDWAALSSYQSCQLTAPLSLTSIDLITPDITCNLVGIIQHIEPTPDRTSLVLTDYGAGTIRLTLWGTRSRLDESVRPGSVVLLTDLYIKEYNGRLQATTTPASRLFHLQAPVPTHSLIGTRVLELLSISAKLFPRPQSKNSVGDQSSPTRYFNSLEEASLSDESGIYMGPVIIQIRHALQSASETARLLVRQYEYRELPIIMNNHIEGVATADVVRMLCADLCPSSIISEHQDTVFQLLCCLNAPGNSPFYCRVVVAPVTNVYNGMKVRAFTLISIYS